MDKLPTNELMVRNIRTRDAMIDHDYDLDDFEEEIPKPVTRWSAAALLAVVAVIVTIGCIIPSPYIPDEDSTLINHVLPASMHVYTPFTFHRVPKPKPQPVIITKEEIEANHRRYDSIRAARRARVDAFYEYMHIMHSTRSSANRPR